MLESWHFVGHSLRKVAAKQRLTIPIQPSSIVEANIHNHRNVVCDDETLEASEADDDGGGRDRGEILALPFLLDLMVQVYQNHANDPLEMDEKALKSE